MPGEQEGWRFNLLSLAKMLDKLPEAEQWIEAFQHKISAYREAPSNNGEARTLLTARLHQDELKAYCHPGMREILFDDFGFQPALPMDQQNEDV